MGQRLRIRLGELRQEYERGDKMIGETEMQMQNLKESLLRISGAIMVLEEEIKLLDAGPRETSLPANTSANAEQS